VNIPRSWKIALVVIAALGLYAALYNFAAWNERQDIIDAIEKGQAEGRVALEALGRDIDAVDKHSRITGGWLVKYAEGVKRGMRATAMTRAVLAEYPAMKAETLDGILKVGVGE
jgi:hypothetical protein